MHAIRANFIASYSRARNLIQSDEPENPTILFSCLVLLSNTTSFSFFPLFFFRERRERERKRGIYQDSPLLARVGSASFSPRRYEDVYDAQRNFSLKLPTRYSSICAYQEVDNGVSYSPRGEGLFVDGRFFIPRARSSFIVRQS